MGELRRLHASPLLEIGLYDCRRTASGPDPEEWCERPEIALPLRGAFVKHVSGNSVTCDATTAALFNPGETYRVSHPFDGGDLCLILAPARAPLRELLAQSRPERADSATPFQEPALAIGALPALRLRLLRAALASPEAAAGVDELAHALLESLTEVAPHRQARPPARRATRDAQRALADAARRHLREHLERPATLARVAKSLGCTPFHLARVFRRETGWTVHGYATRLRLGALLDRLGEGDVDLSRLAAELGFADHSHLSRRFRQAFGTTPSAFCRRLARAGSRARAELMTLHQD